MPNHRNRKETSAKMATKVLKSRTIVLAAVLGVAAFAALLCRLYYLQIICHDELQEKAVAQQTRSSVITASRGTIYDANGETLAVSASAETIFISPHEITENKCDKDLIAKTLAEILNVDEEKRIRYSVADGIGRSRVRCSKMRNQADFTAASAKDRCENRKTPLSGRQSRSAAKKCIQPYNSMNRRDFQW